MNTFELNLFMKAYGYVQNLILWSKGQRQGAERMSTPQLACFTTKEYQDGLRSKVQFALTCIECVYQFVPLYTRNAVTGELQKPKYVLGLREEFSREILLLLGFAGFCAEEKDKINSGILAASERGWVVYSSRCTEERKLP